MCEDHDSTSNKEDPTYLGSMTHLANMDSKQVASSTILPPITSIEVAGSPRNLLYTLPIELRIMVYEHVFGANNETKPVHLHVHDEIVSQCMFKESWNTCHSIAALLYTCRGIYDEAVNILYNNTRFEIALYYPREGEKCTSLQHNVFQAKKIRVLDRFSELTRSFNMMGSMFIMANLPDVGSGLAAARLTSFPTAITYEKHSSVLDIRVNFFSGLVLDDFCVLLRKCQRDVIIDYHWTSRTTNDWSTSCFRLRHLGACRHAFLDFDKGGLEIGTSEHST